MGSSKKHKEKKERKKHKRDRSKDREKKKHKSSRKDKRKTSEEPIIQLDTSPETVHKPPADDEFDIDKLLDSQLGGPSESAEQRQARKRRRAALEAFRNRLQPKEDSLEKSANNQLDNEMRPGRSSPPKKISKRSPPISQRESPPQDPQLSLSVQQTNKLRAKLGLKPLDVEPPKKHVEPIKIKKEIDEDVESAIKANKLREKLGLAPKSLPESPTTESGEARLSLSISETNKLRAKLGLRPLDVGNETSGVEQEEQQISKPAAEVFVQTENLAEKKRSEVLRERIKVNKEKRSIEDRLRKTKGVADSDSDDESAASWVVKHQKILREKEEAEKRAKMLEDMDAEFGISALVSEEFGQKNAYTSKHLKGLTIGHDTDAFKEGHNVILTLKDKGVLDEEEDVLENVNILDNERYAKNVENKKKKPEYKAYDEPEYDEFGILKKKSMLSKYDEEIEGEKKKSFKIGNAGAPAFISKEQELELIRMRLKQQNVMSLDMPDMKVASEYYTASDMAKFKRPKRKRKIHRKTLKADELVSHSENIYRDFGSRRSVRKRPKDDDDDDDNNDDSNSGIPLIKSQDDVDLSSVKIDEETAEKDTFGAIHKAKKLKERKLAATAPEKVLQLLGESGVSPAQKSEKSENIEMDSVAEFCRTLGDIPTYGMSGNRDEEAEDMMDLEEEIQHEIDMQNQGAWNEVNIEDKPVDVIEKESRPILEEEPDIATGVSGALTLATKKGYLDKEEEKKGGSSRASQLQAQSYTIEEKFYEDDKFGKRGDRAFGLSSGQDFREKSNYKPDVKLEYIDDSGRLLSSKEAFRYLSHKFHGKGPGKNKVDKRMKKLQQDNRLKQMSSTDTPLHTVKLLQAKQKETQSPYIVLSGGNKTLTQTMIAKPPKNI